MGDRAPDAEDATVSAHSYHTCLLLPSLADACCVRYFDYFHGPSPLLHAIQGFLDCLVEGPIPPVLPFGFKPATIAFTARIELDFSQDDFGTPTGSLPRFSEIRFVFSIGALERWTFGTILNSASLPLHYF